MQADYWVGGHHNRLQAELVPHPPVQALHARVQSVLVLLPAKPVDAGDAGAVISGVSLSAVCRESVCQDMSLAVLRDDPKVSVFKCHIGAILREK